MPKRTDIHKILIIGAGPIIISQACEFDYSGTQACKALKEEGFEVVLVNSNPATIMTDPETADRTYIEPITPETVAMIIEKERPDALLPTLGGQTGLNTAVEVARMGTLERYGVEMIGATLASIKKAEDRDMFRSAMNRIGLKIPRSGIVTDMAEVQPISAEIGFPIIVRPSYTLGGTGGGVAYNPEDLETLTRSGLDASLIHQVMLEQSVLGWKEFELEVMRDKNDNVVIVCSIENLDPMGVHTGDSITVAPAQTLSDREYQVMRNASIAIMREIGVDTGGSNVQFAVNPANGEMIVVEMNPRVSRSSAFGADGQDTGEAPGSSEKPPSPAVIEQKLAVPNSQRIFYLHHALLAGFSIERIHELSGIDPWFLHQLEELVAFEGELRKAAGDLPTALLRRAKRRGYSDRQLAHLSGLSEAALRARRRKEAILPVYKLVDTCAAEFRAATPYYYSTYEQENEARLSGRNKVMILGGGPNRIGQGIEFDYCCVHASFALREEGIESIMVNSNPETVSTDYDTSDKLYFEPLTLEDVLHIVETERPQGVIVQFGGQTPLNLAVPLAQAGVPILGTQPDKHRPRRGPRRVPVHAAKAGVTAAGQRHGPVGGRSRKGRRADRLPGDRAPLLRAGRPGHENRLPPQGPGKFHPAGHPGLPRPPGADRQISGRRRRGGCGRHLRRAQPP
jgi:carbamoyl-phosphate synthase large subunit